MTDFTAAEKRADAARTNALRDWAQILNQMLGPALSIVNVDINGRPLVIHTSPAQLSELVGSMFHTVKQLELSLNVLIDLMLERRLVTIDARTPPMDQTIPAGLELSNVTREEFWTRVAAAAERNTELMRRAVLSQGQVRPNPGILVPN